LERLRRLRIVRLHVGMDFLGLAAPRLFYRFEVGVALQPEHFERAHLVRASAAIARAAPAVMRGGSIAGVRARLGALARLGLGLFEAFEIVPLGIVFGGVALAEIPALRTVRRLGRRAVAGLVAAVAVAQPNLGRLARAAVATPARESPVERTLRSAHDLNPQESIGFI